MQISCIYEKRIYAKIQIKEIQFDKIHNKKGGTYDHEHEEPIQC